jgi:uncharacterized protein involved in propanediol utilization
MLASQALIQQYNTGKGVTVLYIHTVGITASDMGDPRSIGSSVSASAVAACTRLPYCTHICQSHIASSASFTTNQPYSKQIQGKQKKD